MLAGISTFGIISGHVFAGAGTGAGCAGAGLAHAANTNAKQRVIASINN